MEEKEKGRRSRGGSKRRTRKTTTTKTYVKDNWNKKTYKII